MQIITIDLIKSPDVAQEVVDLQPGDSVTVHTTIKAMDDQTLTLTVDEVSIPKDDGDGTDTETGAEDMAERVDSSLPAGDGLGIPQEEAQV